VNDDLAHARANIDATNAHGIVPWLVGGACLVALPASGKAG
jgi:hypothetical protein